MLNVANSISFGMGFQEVENLPLRVAMFLREWLEVQWEEQENELKKNR